MSPRLRCLHLIIEPTDLHCGKGDQGPPGSGSVSATYWSRRVIIAAKRPNVISAPDPLTLSCVKCLSIGVSGQSLVRGYLKYSRLRTP